MPSLRLWGRQWHLASDALPLLGLALLLPSLALTVAYAVVLAAVHEPPGCSGSQACIREAVVWGTLAAAAAHVVGASAIVAVGTRGGPRAAHYRSAASLQACWPVALRSNVPGSFQEVVAGSRRAAGSPFEVSKRRLMVPLLYLQTTQWILWLCFAVSRAAHMEVVCLHGLLSAHLTPE